MSYLYVDYAPPNYITFQSKAFGFTAVSTQRIVVTESVAHGMRFTTAGQIYQKLSTPVFKNSSPLAQQRLFVS